MQPLKPFALRNPKRSLMQIYVDEADHSWIKQLASTHSVKMVYIVAELVEYAKHASEVFTQQQTQIDVLRADIQRYDEYVMANKLPKLELGL